MEQNLDQKILDQLKQCSKDDASFSKLRELFEDLYTKYQELNKQLSLIEQAIKYDYDSILITDLNLEKPGPKIVYVNEGFTKMTGYTKEEVIGKTPRILQGEKTDRHVLDRLKKRLIEGQAFFGHTVNYKKDGTEFINQWDIHPLTNNKGEITHWVSYQRDITERKESSKLIFNAQVDFDNLIEESKKTFVDLDVQGNIITANNSFKTIIGYDGDELKTINIWDLVDDKDKTEVKSLFSDFDSKEVGDDSYKWKFINKDGENILLEGNINYFASNDETVIRVQFDNLTLREKIIDTLKKKKEKFKAIADKKDEFSLRFIRDESGNQLCKFVSEGFNNLTGLNSNIILEKGVFEVLHTDDITETEKALEKAFSGKPSSISCRYKTEGGDFINVVQSFKPDYDTNTNNVGSVKSVAMLKMGVES